MRRFVLQHDIGQDGIVSFFSGIGATIGIEITFRHVIQCSTPSITVKSMIGGRLRRSGHLFHSIAMSHGTVGEGFFFNFDNASVFDELSCLGIVDVAEDTFGGDGLDGVCVPWVSVFDCLCENMN